MDAPLPGAERTMKYRVNILRIVLSTVVGPGAITPSSAALAHELCPVTTAIVPRECNHKTIRDGFSMDCAAPGSYWFNSAAGLGCARKVSNINLSMARVLRDSVWHNQYILTYNLYTGNGFHDDTGGFHIDAYLKNGNIVRDILGKRIDFDFTSCYYKGGKTFRVPPPGKNPGQTSFNFVATRRLTIRVDKALATGKHSQC
jgi:hypothetical protein